MKPVFEYFDYREFLKDHYEENKQRYPFFSYRYIASKSGLDASFYVKVLQKQMHIAERSIAPLARFLKMGKRETEYFTTLVGFCKGKGQEEMRRRFEKLISLREPAARTLEAAQYEYYTKWYHTVVRELLNFFPFEGDFQALGNRLNPPISAVEARKSIELLEHLGLVAKTENGNYALTDRFVTTGESWQSIAIRNFQKEMIERALESIDRFPKHRRETSTLTVSVSCECLAAMKERLREVRKELLEMARLDECPEAVFQINFQIFPLTKIDGGRQ
jgi:uncharacterized protein (TIGR02147 family)